MAVTIKKFTRLAIYAFFLVLTAFISALFGGKKSTEQGSQISLIPTTAHADLTPSPSSGDSPAAPSPSPGAGSDCDSGSDSGDCCE